MLYYFFLLINPAPSSIVLHIFYRITLLFIPPIFSLFIYSFFFSFKKKIIELEGRVEELEKSELAYIERAKSQMQLYRQGGGGGGGEVLLEGAEEESDELTSSELRVNRIQSAPMGYSNSLSQRLATQSVDGENKYIGGRSSCSGGDGGIGGGVSGGFVGAGEQWAALVRERDEARARLQRILEARDPMAMVLALRLGNLPSSGETAVLPNGYWRNGSVTRPLGEGEVGPSASSSSSARRLSAWAESGVSGARNGGGDSGEIGNGGNYGNGGNGQEETIRVLRAANESLEKEVNHLRKR